MDLGFLGYYSIDDTFQHMLLCRDSNYEPQTPDAAPTYFVYDEDGNEVQTASLAASDHASKTGLRRGTSVLSSANGYAAGTTYKVYYTYDISATAFSDLGTFTVL